jgi:hypothetical protein
MQGLVGAGLVCAKSADALKDERDRVTAGRLPGNLHRMFVG